MSKVSKERARYQNTPRDGDMCRNCTMFRPPAGCITVAGVISPRGWCRFFEAKEKSHPLNRSER